MSRGSFAISSVLLSGSGFLIGLTMFGSTLEIAMAERPKGTPPMQLLIGDADLIEGGVVVTWARVLRDNDVKEVGVTIPVAFFEALPEHGSGPAGANTSLAFPAIAQDTTYFNHFELHSNPHGHDTPPGSVNPIRNSEPHFDFHFYAVSEETVWGIPASTLPPPLLPRVPAGFLPVGYTPPGPSVLEMGRHSGPVSALFDPDFLSTVMIIGYLPDASSMHFLEPMISREFLLERNDFELPVPKPEHFGRSMRYPSRFTAEYDWDSDAYHFVFSEFETVQ